MTTMKCEFHSDVRGHKFNTGAMLYRRSIISSYQQPAIGPIWPNHNNHKIGDSNYERRTNNPTIVCLFDWSACFLSSFHRFDGSNRFSRCVSIFRVHPSVSSPLYSLSVCLSICLPASWCRCWFFCLHLLASLLHPIIDRLWPTSNQVVGGE